MGMERLAPDAVICCLAFLDDISLFRMCTVNTYFFGVTNHAVLWKSLLKKYLLIDDDTSYPPGYDTQAIPSVSDSKVQYLAWKRSFSGYALSDVGKVMSFWRHFTSWCSAHAPAIIPTFGTPATEEEIVTAQEALGVDIPSTLRLFYRFHNGQNFQSHAFTTLGMFGGTVFYDMLTCMSFLPLNRLFVTEIALNFMKRDENGAAMTHDIPISIAFGVYAANPGIISKLYAVVENPTCAGDYVVCTNGDGGNEFLPCYPVDPACRPCADGILSWFEEYLRRVETGTYAFEPLDLTSPQIGPPPPSAPSMIFHFPLKPVHNPRPRAADGEDAAGPSASVAASGQIRMDNDGDDDHGSLARDLNFGASVAVTNGVEVVACPVFIPERSQPSENIFFWYYCIRMRLLRDHPSRPPAMQQCQLLSRHWRIFDPVKGHSAVDGEAVVGLYPLLSINYSQPDADYPLNLPFAYQSGSSATAFPGTFEGHMTFVWGSKERPTGPRFDVKLEAFTLAIPDYLY